MVHKLTPDWMEEFYGPFIRRDGTKVTLENRSVEDGFVMYTSTDGDKYHASGRCVDGIDDHQIDGHYVAKTVSRRKKVAKRTRQMDTRLQNLLKIQTQARRDVSRYVGRKWPVGKQIKFYHRGITCYGNVAQHDTLEGVVVVILGDNRKMRVPYIRVIDRKAKGL
jgi:hypothetical protein